MPVCNDGDFIFRHTIMLFEIIFVNIVSEVINAEVVAVNVYDDRAICLRNNV